MYDIPKINDVSRIIVRVSCQGSFPYIVYISFQGNPHSKTVYLHLPSIFPIKRVGGLSVLMRAWLHRDHANQHSAIYIVLLSAYEVVDVNGWNAFPYIHFKSKWHVDL